MNSTGELSIMDRGKPYWPCPSCHLSDEIYTYHLGATEATVTCRRCKVQTYGSSADVIWRQFGSSQSDRRADE